MSVFQNYWLKVKIVCLCFILQNLLLLTSRCTEKLRPESLQRSIPPSPASLKKKSREWKKMERKDECKKGKRKKRGKGEKVAVYGQYCEILLCHRRHVTSKTSENTKGENGRSQSAISRGRMRSISGRKWEWSWGGCMIECWPHTDCIRHPSIQQRISNVPARSLHLNILRWPSVSAAVTHRSHITGTRGN